MSHRVISEAVSQYLEHLGISDEEYLTVFGGLRHELQPLLGVIRLLRAVLVPVDPSAEFVAALRAKLMTEPVADLYQETFPHRGRIIVGAAVASVVSAAAIYFVFSRARARAA